ncbi:peptidase S8 and S53 subtilisin kexin sedolisin [Methylobacterium sp. 4-46]|uniref:S8 family serine peptidase n=1 Tax=unclassified Methylobacterium TaxID=2615210 RepID=UPI000152DB65|nr:MULTISPECIES: S8 family serine peptidase [Methylobacterium]ACA15664.1 peptidase S8 and S53 subtilisin kexin sedolisin [Methylobacterium sp. 4-46]WFT81376.1 S8 family serine peptidase [Methylobacterium nodulans]WFT81424.1 S8 family serine peptidase [Methylobacterium nodulans]
MARNVPHSGFRRVLWERPSDPALVRAAESVAAREPPDRWLDAYRVPDGVRLDRAFGAIPIGPGAGAREISPLSLDPRRSERFLVRAIIPVPGSGEIPATLDGGAVSSDAEVGTTLTCGSSRAVGTEADVRTRLDTALLAQNGLDGSGVAIAIVDGGISLARLAARLGTPPLLDAGQSWSPTTIVSVPGRHRVGHGTMCAFDALIAAPKATLLDVPALAARSAGDHSAAGTVGAAIQAYWFLITRWLLTGPPAGLAALVVSNSWGIYHPSLDFPQGHPGRYVDNPNHPFRFYVRALTQSGTDVVFAGSNCGPECPAAPCLQRVQGAIMGANAYPEVLTLAACTTAGDRLGYSAKGPSIAGMTPQKPDVTAYSHFLGSLSRSRFTPDGGTSAACAVAAGCVAALRTRAKPATTSAAAMAQVLRATALQTGPPGWNAERGHGVLRPVEAGRSLGLIP